MSLSREQADRSPEYVSDLLIDILQKLGIEYVAMNPGATFRALHDSLVQYGGNKNPELVLCCHEEIAVAIAEGYFRANGKPMAVMVHDMVGLQHATKAIFEAWVERIPMIIIGGTGPFSVEERRPGIDWIHTSKSNANLVREYVKWDDEPVDVAGAVESILRGYKIAMTPPMGPVYLCYDILLQEKKLESGQMNTPNVDHFKPPTPPQIEGKALSKIAESLVSARLPIIIADRIGQDETSYSHLVQLAELLSIPVIDKGSCLSFPNTNELDVTGGEEIVLKEADLVLAVDVLDLEDALSRSKSRLTRHADSIVNPQATLIQVGMNDYLTRGWSADYRRLYPADLSVSASSKVAISAILTKCKQLVQPSMKSLLDERREYSTKIRQQIRKRWNEDVKKSWEMKPISTSRLATEIWKLIQNEDWVLCHGTLRGWFRKLWTLDDPRRYFGPSSGTGSGVGTSIGAALAMGGGSSGKVFVSVVGDGDMLYTSSSLWTAANMKVPLLVIMYNNRSYYQDFGHQSVMAEQRKRDASKVGIGINIVDPAPDFATLARAFSLNGVGPVEDPDQVFDALKKGLDLVKRDRKLTIVDVVTQPR